MTFPTPFVPTVAGVRNWTKNLTRRAVIPPGCAANSSKFDQHERFNDAETERSRLLFSPPPRTSTTAVVSRSRTRRGAPLRATLHIRVDDEPDGLVPRRNRPLKRRATSCRSSADARFIAFFRLVLQLAERLFRRSGRLQVRLLRIRLPIHRLPTTMVANLRGIRSIARRWTANRADVRARDPGVAAIGRVSRPTNQALPRQAPRLRDRGRRCRIRAQVILRHARPRSHRHHAAHRANRVARSFPVALLPRRVLRSARLASQISCATSSLRAILKALHEAVRAALRRVLHAARFGFPALRPRIPLPPRRPRAADDAGLDRPAVHDAYRADHLVRVAPGRAIGPPSPRRLTPSTFVPRLIASRFMSTLSLPPRLTTAGFIASRFFRLGFFLTRIFTPGLFAGNWRPGGPRLGCSFLGWRRRQAQLARQIIPVHRRLFRQRRQRLRFRVQTAGWRNRLLRVRLRS